MVEFRPTYSAQYEHVVYSNETLKSMQYLHSSSSLPILAVRAFHFPSKNMAFFVRPTNKVNTYSKRGNDERVGEESLLLDVSVCIFFNVFAVQRVSLASLFRAPNLYTLCETNYLCCCRFSFVFRRSFHCK